MYFKLIFPGVLLWTVLEVVEFFYFFFPLLRFHCTSWRSFCNLSPSPVSSDLDDVSSDFFDFKLLRSVAISSTKELCLRWISATVICISTNMLLISCRVGSSCTTSSSSSSSGISAVAASNSSWNLFELVSSVSVEPWAPLLFLCPISRNLFG